MSPLLHEPTYRGDLGNGLIRRWSTPEDMPKIAHIVGTVFRHRPDVALTPCMSDEVRIMMSPGYPFMGPGDFAIVEDTSLPGCPVVACTCCWSHTWSYAGIPFGVGRPELVATLPEYRNRGLIRSLFAMFHARSASKGEQAQAITGIPPLLPAVRLRICARCGRLSSRHHCGNSPTCRRRAGAVHAAPGHNRRCSPPGRALQPGAQPEPGLA